MYTEDARGIWELTAYELDEIISAGHRRDALRAEENELLAYNIGALVLAAFNAPSRYPRSPAEAFGRGRTPQSDGGKSAFAAAASRLNRRLMQKTGDKLC